MACLLHWVFMNGVHEICRSCPVEGLHSNTVFRGEIKNFHPNPSTCTIPFCAVMRVEGYVDLYGVWLWILVLQCQLAGRFHSLAFSSGWLSVFVGCLASSCEKLRSLTVLRGEPETCLCPAVQILTVTLESLAVMMQSCQCLLDQGQNPLCCLSFGSIGRFWSWRTG